jgi:hypothetical protein
LRVGDKILFIKNSDIRTLMCPFIFIIMQQGYELTITWPKKYAEILRGLNITVWNYLYKMRHYAFIGEERG